MRYSCRRTFDYSFQVDRFLQRMNKLPDKAKKVIEKGFPKIRGTSVGGHHNEDYSFFVSILGYPNLGKLLVGIVEKNMESFLGGKS